MAFSSARTNDPSKVGAGERFGANLVILSAIAFEDGLKVGRFAKLDAGSIDNLDGSATPTLAGVVLRNVASAIEDGGAIDADLQTKVDYMRQGLVTAEVVTGQTPTQFGAVFVSNAGDANDGALLTAAGASGIAADAEFIEEIDTDVWLIRLK